MFHFIDKTSSLACKEVEELTKGICVHVVIDCPNASLSQGLYTVCLEAIANGLYLCSHTSYDNFQRAGYVLNANRSRAYLGGFGSV